MATLAKSGEPKDVLHRTPAKKKKKKTGLAGAKIGTKKSKPE